MTTPVYVTGANSYSDFSATVTVSITPSGTNRCVVAMVFAQTTAVNTPSGCTYNGVTMTAGPTGLETGTSRAWAMYYLTGDANIATGAHDVVGSFSGANYDNIHGGISAHAYSNVDSLTDATGNGASNTAPTWTGIDGSAGDLAAVVGLHVFGQTMTAGSGVTKDFDSATGTHNAEYPYCALSKAGGAAVTIDTSMTGSANPWFGAAFNLVAASAAATYPGKRITAKLQAVQRSVT